LPITYGFEAEFETGVEQLSRTLYLNGLVGATGLHGYHCSCETCDFDSGYPYRIQRDSSCGGEVISHPFVNDDPTDAILAMEGLQRAAVDSDAEPGYRAGFHVHVSRPRASAARADLFWNFLRWEPELMRLAHGRFPSLREGQNTPVERMLRGIYIDGYGRVNSDSYMTLVSWQQVDEVLRDGESEFLNGAKVCAMEYHRNNDRHSNLNLGTNHGTWEWRLFNSTRSAWRMELFTSVAVAFMDPSLRGALYEATPSLDRLPGILADNGRRRASELVERQAAYCPDTSRASVFTLL
jgi:hypothetical protein